MPTKTTFDVKVYNELPQLESATGTLNAAKAAFDVFIREASTLLGSSNVADGQVGAFLLHRHWALKPGTIMVERPRVLESGKVALVTAATDEAKARRTQIQPSRWSAPSRRRPFVPLEFSSDPFVAEVGMRLFGQRALLAALAGVLQKHGLERTIGFMIIPRKSLRTERYPDFVETNRDGMSIVTGEKLSATAKREVIMTGWPLATTRVGSVFACCYCSHPGGGLGCRHPKPDPPVCKPHGCV